AAELDDFVRSHPVLSKYVEGHTTSNPEQSSNEKNAKAPSDGLYFRGEILPEALRGLTTEEKERFGKLKDSAAAALERFKAGFRQIDKIKGEIRQIEGTA